MRFVVAVSGGVDSVVLLDLMVKKMSGKDTLAVAHVDHGIREDSADDARFVRELAARYGLSFASIRAELGADASEDAARTARYDYLRVLAAQLEARIVTAHHRDDVVESIAINLHRGTGWRGLAVMNAPGVVRPLLGWTKAQIYDYALLHRLEWVEDSTNRSDRYLRNWIRGLVHQRLSSEQRHQLVDLRTAQVQLAAEVDQLSAELIDRSAGNRYFYIMVDIITAIELLRDEIEQHTSKRPTRQQAERAVVAIRTARPGTRHDVGDGSRLEFSSTQFVVAR